MVLPMATPHTPQLPLTIRGMRAIAAYAGIGEDTVRAAIHTGALPKLAGTGRDTVVLREDVQAWVRSLRTTEAAS
jgi:excisionase family DNA binding protein